MRQLQKLLEEALKATLEESRELKDLIATAQRLVLSSI